MLILGERLPGAPAWVCASVGVGLRFVIASLVLGLGLLVRRSRDRSFDPTTRRLEREQGLVLGGCVGLAIILQVIGLATIDASVSAFLTQLYAVIVPVMVAARARRWPSHAIVGAVAFALLGTGWLAGLRWNALRLGSGELLTMASAFLIAIQVIWLNRTRYIGTDPYRMSLVMFGAVAATGLSAATGPWGLAVLQELVTHPPLVGMTILMGIFSTVVTFTLMNLFQPRVTAVEAGMLYTTEPIFAALGALILPQILGAWGGVRYPNEALTWNLAAGAVCVLIAIALVQRDGPRPVAE